MGKGFPPLQAISMFFICIIKVKLKVNGLIGIPVYSESHIWKKNHTVYRHNGQDKF